MKSSIYLFLILSFLCQSFGEDVNFYKISTKELDELISNAAPEVQYRNNGKAYLPRRQTPYTGWTAQFYKNGGIKWMTRFEDGEIEQVCNWDQDGIIRRRSSDFPQYEVWSTSGKRVGARGINKKWKYVAEISLKPGTSIVHGIYKTFYFSGQQRTVNEYKEGKMMTQIRFKPNGDKCPVTNLKDGNGVVVSYNDDGTEDGRFYFKNGKEVK